MQPKITTLNAWRNIWPKSSEGIFRKYNSWLELLPPSFSLWNDRLEHFFMDFRVQRKSEIKIQVTSFLIVVFHMVKLQQNQKSRLSVSKILGIMCLQLPLPWSLQTQWFLWWTAEIPPTKCIFWTFLIGFVSNKL